MLINFSKTDYLQISLLPSKSLLRLPLQVLTLSNNRIDEIEKLALPPTVWFLDLKNNVIQEVSADFSLYKLLDILKKAFYEKFKNFVNLKNSF